MTVRFYVAIDGTKQGKFKGESGTHKGKLEGVGFSYACEIPPSTSGQASRRAHSPVTFTKMCGAASPQLLQALYTSEMLKSVRFEFVRPGGDGDKVFQTLTLTNAQVVRVSQRTGPAGEDGAATDAELVEDVSVSFQKIEVVNVVAGTEAVDSAPNTS